MKKISILLFLILPMLGMTQTSQLNDVFDKYSGQEGYTSIYITSYMFDLFARVAEDSDEDFEGVTKGLEAIKILTVSGDSTKNTVFFDDLNKALDPKIYKDFMIINDEGQEIIFKVRDEGNKISEFVMIVKDEYEPVLIFLQGDIDLKQVAKMSRSMDIKGFEHLEKIEE